MNIEINFKKKHLYLVGIFVFAFVSICIGYVMSLGSSYDFHGHDSGEIALSNYAVKSDLNGYVTSYDLNSYATQSELTTKRTQIPDMTGYATEVYYMNPRISRLELYCIRCSVNYGQLGDVLTEGSEACELIPTTSSSTYASNYVGIRAKQEDGWQLTSCDAIVPNQPGFHHPPWPNAVAGRTGFNNGDQCLGWSGQYLATYACRIQPYIYSP